MIYFMTSDLLVDDSDEGKREKKIKPSSPFRIK